MKEGRPSFTESNTFRECPTKMALLEDAAGELWQGAARDVIWLRLTQKIPPKWYSLMQSSGDMCVPVQCNLQPPSPGQSIRAPADVGNHTILMMWMMHTHFGPRLGRGARLRRMWGVITVLSRRMTSCVERSGVRATRLSQFWGEG